MEESTTKGRNGKVLKKYSPNEICEIIKVFDKLKNMIETEEYYGTRFENIYNNDSIKYDVFKGGFYTFKAQGKDRSQIRILYRFIRNEDGKYDVHMHRVYIKRRNTKEYMNEFSTYVDNYIRNQKLKWNYGDDDYEIWCKLFVL